MLLRSILGAQESNSSQRDSSQRRSGQAPRVVTSRPSPLKRYITCEQEMAGPFKVKPILSLARGLYLRKILRQSFSHLPYDLRKPSKSLRIPGHPPTLCCPTPTLLSGPTIPRANYGSRAQSIDDQEPAITHIPQIVPA